MVSINQSNFKALVKRASDEDYELTLEDIGDVFGKDFYIMLVTMLMDAQDAARAIQGAISRLGRPAPMAADADDFDEDDD